MLGVLAEAEVAIEAEIEAEAEAETGCWKMRMMICPRLQHKPSRISYHRISSLEHYIQIQRIFQILMKFLKKM
jgi:hypothetical protein